jgi:hypothetical protein
MNDWLMVLQAAIDGRKDLNKQTVAIEEDLRKQGQNIKPEELQFEDDVIGSGTDIDIREEI